MEHNQFIRNMTGVVALGIAVFGASINNTPIVATTYDIDSAYYESSKDYSNASLIANSDNYFTLSHYNSGFVSIEREAFELFGSMRDATNEERASVRRYIQDISINTGVNFFDLC